ncbi:MAG TPA: DUF2182 domain-containing protein [Acetobacteraceae bacterium]|nr:DUF2182 domain-containing protein [Acetobacteraceae bacterium]
MAPGRYIASLAAGPLGPLLLLSAGAWAVLLGSGGSTAISAFCGVPAASLDRSWRTLELALALASPRELLIGWVLMVLAMTPPLMAEHVAHLWRGSLARRRWRALACFGAGALAAWLAAGAPLVLAAFGLKALVGAAPGAALGLALALATAWQFSAAKQECLDRCHILRRVPVFGWAADRDCLRYGWIAAAWCILSCWAAMLVALVADHGHALLMLALGLALLAERLRRPRRRRRADRALAEWVAGSLVRRK